VSYDKCRQVGRVPDDIWQQLKMAAKRSRKNFTTWSIEAMLWYEQKQNLERERNRLKRKAAKERKLAEQAKKQREV
jgi:hypothetical protein